MSEHRNTAASPSLSEHLERAIRARESQFDAAHHAALRLFNGFTEGPAPLVIDLYGSTLVLNNYASPPEDGSANVEDAAGYVRSLKPWIRAIIVKDRGSESTDLRHGRLRWGGPADDRVQEDGIWYAIDLTLGRDSSFYVDTRNLRSWARRTLGGKTVLNAFAYTGSLGVAAAAGGAKRVVQLDRSRKFLSLAERSHSLNGMALTDAEFLVGDFFRQAGRFRRQDRRFDCVFVDPPFFAAGPAGTVDQVHDSARLINKARPLVEDGGYLVTINNALYVSGSEYLETIERLCADGYLRLMQLIPVPDDCVGYGPGHTLPGVADPSPFNHPTKIVVLEVRRKPQASG